MALGMAGTHEREFPTEIDLVAVSIAIRRGIETLGVSHVD
jgi:hypothetical protein